MKTVKNPVVYLSGAFTFSALTMFYMLNLPICATEDSTYCVFLNKNGRGYSFISLWDGFNVPSWMPIVLAAIALLILWAGTILMDRNKNGVVD